MLSSCVLLVVIVLKTSCFVVFKLSSLGAGVDVDGNGNGKAVDELIVDIGEDDIVVTFKTDGVVDEDEFVELSSANTYIDIIMTSNNV